MCLRFLAAVCLVAAYATAAPNLLPNSSFEEDTAGWSLWHENPDVSSGGVTEVATPEPGTLMLLSSGIFAIGAMLRRRMK